MGVIGGLDWRDRLAALGSAVRQRIISVRDSGEEMDVEVDQIGGDTIFAIDRQVEPVVIEHVESWQLDGPMLLVMEGLNETGTLRIGDPDAPLRYRMIVDPIDGTRSLMYDKRSAWFIAAVADEYGDETSLRHTFASAIMEIPTSKQVWVDDYLAVRYRGDHAIRHRLDRPDDPPRHREPRPSEATTLRNGFGQVSNFFPGTKVLASELMERICKADVGDVVPGSAAVFDDQYITTGGQFVELMVGHDRFCCDLRPLFYRALAHREGGDVPHGLACHPYDVGGLLVANQTGVVLTDGFGHPLDAPLDVHTPVHWCGYANEALRRRIEPVIQFFWQENGMREDDIET